MKWDEIHDQSRVAVDKAIGRLLTGENDLGKEEDDILKKLQDAEYVCEKLEKRKCYSGRDAFLRLKRQVKRKKRLRVAMWLASAACVAIVYNIVAVRTNRSVVAGNEHDRKTRKYFPSGDESNISKSGRGTSRVRKRAS